MKHGRSAYTSGQCRCDICRQANARYAITLKARLMAKRTLIDGRWVAPLPAERHGRESTYVNHGCRCDPCTEAGVAANARAAQRWR